MSAGELREFFAVFDAATRIDHLLSEGMVPERPSPNRDWIIITLTGRGVTEQVADEHAHRYETCYRKLRQQVEAAETAVSALIAEIHEMDRVARNVEVRAANRRLR